MIDIDKLLELESKASKAPYRLENHNKLSADNKLVPYSKDDAELDIAMRNTIRPLLLELKAARKVVEAARLYISSRKVLMENQKEVDWDAFENLESALKELEGGEVTNANS